MDSSGTTKKASTPVIPANRQLRANRFARIGRQTSFIKAVLFGAVLIWLAFGGFSAKITAYLGLPSIQAAMVYALLLIIVYGILSIPFDFYKGFLLARRYGLSVQGFGGWLAGYLQSALLVSTLVIGIVVTAFWSISILPEMWWLLAWAVLMVVSL
ncbi:MAG: hypothetical protein WC970_06705, partial [Dehalococcoidales bacterium]